MSLNTTNITGQAISSLQYNLTANNVSKAHGLEIDPANNLGNGLGKIIREAFDHLWHTWHKIEIDGQDLTHAKAKRAMQQSGALTSGQTIGIVAGVCFTVVIGILIVVLLRWKRKACFAKKAENPPPNPPDTVVEFSDQTLTNSLIIPKNDIEIGKQISEWSFGEIYRGSYQNKDIVIKQLKSHLEPQEVAKFLTEGVKTMAELRSPYIVTFYGVTKEQPFMFVMEYMEGGSLQGFLKTHNPDATPWDLRLQIIHDISQGLAYLHENKIVHGNLKSTNILLNKKNHAKLWMTPESFNRRQHTFATDMYSLGVILWEVATHRPPFQKPQWEIDDVIAQIDPQEKKEQFPKGTPKAYEKLANLCWDENSTKRPNSEEAAAIIAGLWKRQKATLHDPDKKEESPIKSASDLSYLTDTTFDPQKPAEKKPAYENNEQTRFGI